MRKNPNMGRPVANKHKVPKKQWDRWSNPARKMFNHMFLRLRPTNQFVFSHPDAPPVLKDHWQTLRWNVAWEAACAVDGESHADIVRAAA